MNVALYVYEGYFETEIALAALLFKREKLFTIACGPQPVRGVDGRCTVVDRRVAEVRPCDVDVLVIPGGSPSPEPDALELIRGCEAQGALIGGICGGVDLMAHAGILSGRRFTSYYDPSESYGHLPADGTLTHRAWELDRRVVTASYHAYLEFALVLAREAGVLGEETFARYADWFKRPLQLDCAS